ncbi:hypothetical protein Zmor_017105 [Zophobas morio]|uniref:Uncharacterized protein n=1 Tax=Zophobas morio TaxID=2755281 RepID=A0AA38IBT8_9CUCU|nr:hypothetical protein Zmor_017105 [Zophobas morio]
MLVVRSYPRRDQRLSTFSMAAGGEAGDCDSFGGGDAGSSRRWRLREAATAASGGECRRGGSRLTESGVQGRVTIEQSHKFIDYQIV